MLLTTYISKICMQAHEFSTQLQTPEALSPSTSSTLIMHSWWSPLCCTFLTLYISLFTMLLEVPPSSSSHTPVVLPSHVPWKSWSTVTQQAQNSYTTKRGFHAQRPEHVQYFWQSIMVVTLKL
jgi:ABC-type polysaccharide/polyol phosphate export permease